MASKKELIQKLWRENPGKTGYDIAVKAGTTARYARMIRSEMWKSAKNSLPKAEVTKHSKRTVGIMSDIHVPYHDEKAVRVTLDYFHEVNVDEIVLLGDVCDFYKISFFKGDPRRMSFQEELDVARGWLRDLRKEFPEHKITYVMGNHEVRLERYINDKAPELAGINSLTVPGILELDSLGIDFIDNVDRLVKGESPLTLGKLTLLHGHEVRASYGAVNIPRLYFMKVHTNVLFGHVHKAQSYITKDIHGTIMGAWSIGCLCHLRERYMPVNEWTTGFAVVRVNDTTGKFSVDNKMIIDGEVL